MENANDIVEKVWALVEPTVREAGADLVDVEYARGPQGRILRLRIDKGGGVTLDDCEAVSRIIGDVLDAHDPIPGAYSLEVSSPGINRPLKRWKDFVRFQGDRVFVETREAVSGRRRFTGVMASAEDGLLRIRVEGAGVFEIPFEQVAKARLDIL